MTGAPAPAPRHPTVCDSLAAAAESDTDVTFVDLREHEVRIPWREVHRRAVRAARGLLAVGIGRGDRVALVYRTEPAFLDAFFGVLLAGAVPVPLYPPIRLGRLEEYHAATARMLEVSAARLVLAGGGARRLLGEAVARARPALGCRPVDALPNGSRALPGTRPEDLALVQFSSGSTVDPKPVALSHSNVVAQCAALIALIRPTPEDRLVSWLPLYHDMGLIGCLLGALSYPGPLVLIPPEHFLARPALWLRAIARHRATVSAAPDFAFGYTVRRVRDEEVAGIDLGPWRIALDGAEPISAAALRRFGERFSRFGLDPSALMPVYGLSEAALAVTFSPRRGDLRSVHLDPLRLAARGEVAPGPREIVSVGRPIPGVDVEVRGAGGRELPDGRIGRIHVRGPSVMRGYLGDEAATRRAIREGWLDTGDLGFTVGGELFVYGRAKDVVVVRGANHAPEEFEACLEGVTGVRPGCAVAIGVPGEDGGEALCVLAERARDAGALPGSDIEERIRRVVLERTGVRPEGVRLLPPGTLPRTSSGKMRRREALRRFVAGTLAPPKAMGPLGLAREIARSSIAYARSRLERSSQGA